MKSTFVRVALLASVSALCMGLDESAPLFPTGLTFASDATYQSVPLATTPLTGPLPPSTSMVADFPAPGDQGRQGSCVGWAVAYATKSYQEKIERLWDMSSQDHLFSAAYIYNQIKTTPGCAGGTFLIDALNLVTREGVATMHDFPYDSASCSAQPSAAAKQAARQFAIATWRRVNVQDETEVKAQLSAGFPVIIGMAVDDGFMALRGGNIYSGPSGASRGGHALTVIGYDDARSAFQVINSWGRGWGDGGFGWVSYGAFRQTVREGYVAQDIISVRPQPTPQPQPQPTPQPQPQPTPQPSPVFVNPSAPTAILGTPTLNFGMQTPRGWALGIHPTGSVKDARGKTLQVVARFFSPNGAQLFANAQEFVYRDSTGFVATGTSPMIVDSNSYDLRQLDLVIPYYALNFAPTNGMFNYQVNMVINVYIDGFAVAQSMPVSFGIRW